MIFLCFLLIAVPGCDMNTPAPKAADSDAQQLYAELVHDRWALQEIIGQRIDSYRLTRLEVHRQDIQLKRYLGDKPIPETIEEFRTARAKENEGRPSGIPRDLVPAYSYWKEQMIPHELHLKQITEDVDGLMHSGLLEELYGSIIALENERQRGVLDVNRLQQIERRVAEAKGRLNLGDTLKKDLIDHGIIEEQKGRLSHEVLIEP